MRGCFKFVCEDCQGETMISPRARNSRFKPRCRHCGSPYLVPSPCSDFGSASLVARDAFTEQRKQLDKKMGIENEKQTKI